jgi:hypothetical protein
MINPQQSNLKAKPREEMVQNYNQIYDHKDHISTSGMILSRRQ